MTTPSTDRVEAAEGDSVLETDTDAVNDEIVPELVEEDEDFLHRDDDFVPDEGRTGSGIAGGAAAIVAAGLALVSMSGSWLGDVLGQRQTLIGQINTANSAADAIIKQRYTEPWHKTALVGIWFAVAAMLVAAGTLFVTEFFAKRETPTWVRALTWGALALGVLGLGVSVAWYFDVFTGTISVPAGAAGNSSGG
jgi:drug/metabolite transporter (DMT)-like permease